MKPGGAQWLIWDAPLLKSISKADGKIVENNGSMRMAGENGE